MRPRDISSAWVKHRPWHWSKQRAQPTRKAARRAHIAQDREASQ